jgi:hypothetical protein
MPEFGEGGVYAGCDNPGHAGYGHHRTGYKCSAEYVAEQRELHLMRTQISKVRAWIEKQMKEWPTPEGYVEAAMELQEMLDE